MSEALFAAVVAEAKKAPKASETIAAAAHLLVKLPTATPQERKELDAIEAAFFKDKRDVAWLVSSVPTALRGSHACADANALADLYHSTRGAYLFPPSVKAMFAEIGRKPTVGDLLQHAIQKLGARGELLVMENTVVQPFREKWFGTRNVVEDADLHGLLKACSAFEFPACVTEALEALEAGSQPLCETLRAIVEASTDLKEKSLTLARLCDRRCTFLQLSNVSTLQNKKFFVFLGIDEDDAQELATAIYARHRDSVGNQLESLTPLQRAQRAIDRQLRTVDLSSCNLDHSSVQPFLRSLAKVGAAEHVDLSWNHIHEAAAVHVAALIRGLPTLRQLCLGGNTMLSGGLVQVANALPGTKVTMLSVAGSHADDAIHIFAGVIKKTQLKSLDLAFNGISVQDLSGLDKIVDHVETLSLASNPLGDHGAAKIAGLLSKKMKLRSLDVSNCQLTPQGIETLAIAMGSCATGVAVLIASCNATSSVAGYRPPNVAGVSVVIE